MAQFSLENWGTPFANIFNDVFGTALQCWRSVLAAFYTIRPYLDDLNFLPTSCELVYSEGEISIASHATTHRRRGRRRSTNWYRRRLVVADTFPTTIIVDRVDPRGLSAHRNATGRALLLYRTAHPTRTSRNCDLLRGQLFAHSWLCGRQGVH